MAGRCGDSLADCQPAAVASLPATPQPATLATAFASCGHWDGTRLRLFASPRAGYPAADVLADGCHIADVDQCAPNSHDRLHIVRAAPPLSGGMCRPYDNRPDL